ncbi:MAG: endopeptidase La [Acidobacteriota bacterium]|nr:endopeptidase La [Blastocatellia bacterium]MDW8412096.1 endopeptidase La [Acidobacteriota bacterium]
MEERVSLAVIPLKGTVVYPQMVIPLSVGRPGSLAAAEVALSTEEKIALVVAQRDSNIDEPKAEDLYDVATLVVIRRSIWLNDKTLQLIVQGLKRVKLDRIEMTDKGYLLGKGCILPDILEETMEAEALYRALSEKIRKALSLIQNVPEEFASLIMTTDEPRKLCYMLATLLNLSVEKEQKVLEINSTVELLRAMHAHLAHEIAVLELRQKIQGETQAELSKAQRDYILRQQLKQIQKELGDEDNEKAEVEELRSKINALGLSEELAKEVLKELKRLEKLNSSSGDYQVLRNYLETVAELPWNKLTEDNLDLRNARQVLEEDHYGLDEIKDRILEHLAVMKLNPQARSPILLFVGPPGVGKTSLGQSIARALGRKFERMSLGGVHDEAELRGHRRTYVGAMPGRVIQAIRRAAVRNPVLMLDEVDKLGRDFRGDPAAALLEILDPAQNNSFRDNYLELPFDLSKVFFICTANTTETIPSPLLDRMELISLSGYTEQEKVEIAKRYLIPRATTDAGLSKEQFHISDEALRKLITNYTRESGVRQLERRISQLARKAALKLTLGEIQSLQVNTEELTELLGPQVSSLEQTRRMLEPGVAAGLAWTPTGGEVLYVEATLLPGGKDMVLTGQLGDVMKESARAAMSYFWANSSHFGIDYKVIRDNGIHLHVPAGAVPKDGPSAGVTMATALASLYLKTPMRTDTAMTGEITLSGLVLPIGGVKEKLLAARRAGLKRIILPKGNEKDLRKLPDELRQELEIILVERIEEVLCAAIPRFKQLVESMCSAA